MASVASSAAAASSSTSADAALFAPRPYKLHQTKPTPANGTGAREFYESLWREKGAKSPMALAYLVEHGCLSDKELAKVAAQYAALRKKGASS